MLETIREFVAERLAARPDAAEVARRHAGYYRALAEQADRLLRRAGQREWAGRLQAEAGNLAAAVRWYLAHDREPLPHLLRVLWLFWELQDHMGEVHAWAGQLLPTAGTLDPQARAELLWTAAVTAVEVGDDPAALCGPPAPGTAAGRRSATRSSAPCASWPWRGPRRSSATTWTAPCGRRRRAWASSAARTRPSGPPRPASPSAPWRRPSAATTTPCGHLTEARDLAERFDNALARRHLPGGPGLP